MAITLSNRREASKRLGHWPIWSLTHDALFAQANGFSKHAHSANTLRNQEAFVAAAPPGVPLAADMGYIDDVMRHS